MIDRHEVWRNPWPTKLDGFATSALPRGLTTELFAQTLLGASAMVLHTGDHPAKLKDIVTTPAGCTIHGPL